MRTIRACWRPTRPRTWLWSAVGELLHYDCDALLTCRTSQA